MRKLTYYRQKRFDGGIRTGVEFSTERDFTSRDDFPIDRTILEDFEPPEGERDPSLLWYVDIRCEGEGIPDDALLARQWFVNNGSVMRTGLLNFADHLRRVGVDLDDYPLRWDGFPNIDQVNIKLTASLIRRIDARQFAEILDDIRENWTSRMELMLTNAHAYSTED